MTSLNYSVWLSGASQVNVNLSKWHKLNSICATPGFDFTEQKSDLAEFGSTYVPCKSSELKKLNVKSLFFL